MTPTLGQIILAAEESLLGLTVIGFCLACDAELLHVDSDAAGDECEICGEPEVFSAEELLLREVG